jgi:hypothetical protein
MMSTLLYWGVDFLIWRAAGMNRLKKSMNLFLKRSLRGGVSNDWSWIRSSLTMPPLLELE